MVNSGAFPLRELRVPPSAVKNEFRPDDFGHPLPPFSPSPISLMVSVDVKHHVYLLTMILVLILLAKSIVSGCKRDMLFLLSLLIA